MKRRELLLGAATVPALLAGTSGARADERLRLAIGQGGTFDTAIAALADKAGVFSKYGLTLEISYTQGGGETIQTIVSRSVDIGIGGGTIGLFSAFAKGAPLRIIQAQATGAGDFFWFVPTESPIRSITEISGKTVAFSTVGASTHAVALQFGRQYNVTPRLVATGAILPTYTATMSGQVDVGWSAAPIGVEAQRQGKIRILATGNDVGDFRNQTIRCNMVHPATLQSRRAAITTFIKAYDEALDWAYASPDAVAQFAERTGVSLETAIETRDRYTVRSALQTGEVRGVESLQRDAIAFRYLTEPLTREQLSALIQIPFV